MSKFQKCEEFGIKILELSFRGHKDGVWEVTVSRGDQQVIGTASADHTARVFCIGTGGFEGCTLFDKQPNLGLS